MRWGSRRLSFSPCLGGVLWKSVNNRSKPYSTRLSCRSSPACAATWEGSKIGCPPSMPELGLILGVIGTYLTNYVKKEPQRPADWRRTMSISCYCNDCSLLLQFVYDRHQRVGNFCMAEKRRKHLKSQLDDTFRTTTICAGSPYTLRVEKTNKQYDAALQAWKRESPPRSRN